MLEEKKRRSEGIANEVAKRKVVEQRVDGLYDWIDKLYVKLSEANSTAKAVRKDVKSQQTRLVKISPYLTSTLVYSFCACWANRRAKDNKGRFGRGAYGE